MNNYEALILVVRVYTKILLRNSIQNAVPSRGGALGGMGKCFHNAESRGAKSGFALPPISAKIVIKMVIFCGAFSAARRIFRKIHFSEILPPIIAFLSNNFFEKSKKIS